MMALLYLTPRLKKINLFDAKIDTLRAELTTDRQKITGVARTCEER